MEDPKVVEACAHLTEKFLGSQPYEALQYVQSFVARKKKALGRKLTILTALVKPTPHTHTIIPQVTVSESPSTHPL
jgi:hypothetical protein